MEIGKADALKNRDERPLDYIRGTVNFVDLRDNVLGQSESRKVFKIINSFKNSVVELLLKNRREKKVKNLRKILEDFIAQAKKKKDFEK